MLRRAGTAKNDGGESYSAMLQGGVGGQGAGGDCGSEGGVGGGCNGVNPRARGERERMDQEMAYGVESGGASLRAKLWSAFLLFTLRRFTRCCELPPSSKRGPNVSHRRLRKQCVTNSLTEPNGRCRSSKIEIQRL
jgi:hypothetical protein